MISPIHNKSTQTPTRKPSDKPKKTVGGVVRDVFETVGGVTGGVAQVAASVLPTAIVGAKEGLAKAHDPEHLVDPKKVARDITIGTAAQALLPSAGIGYWASGLKGATVAFTGQAVGGAAGLVLFSKGGAADLIGEKMAQDLEKSLQGETSSGKALAKGAYTGVKSGIKHNFKAGYQEGQGFFSGLVEGVAAIPSTIRDNSEVSKAGSGLLKVAQSVAGLAGAALAAPAGVTQGLVHSFNKSEMGPVKRAAITAGGLALTAAGWPLALGMIGPALFSAGAAAAIGVASSVVAGKDTAEAVPEAVTRASQDNRVLKEEISDSRQHMYEAAFVGGAVGAAKGWDKGVALFGGERPKETVEADPK